MKVFSLSSSSCTRMVWFVLNYYLLATVVTVNGDTTTTTTASSSEERFLRKKHVANVAAVANDGSDSTPFRYLIDCRIHVQTKRQKSVFEHCTKSTFEMLSNKYGSSKKAHQVGNTQTTSSSSSSNGRGNKNDLLSSTATTTTELSGLTVSTDTFGAARRERKRERNLGLSLSTLQQEIKLTSLSSSSSSSSSSPLSVEEEEEGFVVDDLLGLGEKEEDEDFVVDDFEENLVNDGILKESDVEVTAADPVSVVPPLPLLPLLQQQQPPQENVVMEDNTDDIESILVQDGLLTENEADFGFHSVDTHGGGPIEDLSSIEAQDTTFLESFLEDVDFVEGGGVVIMGEDNNNDHQGDESLLSSSSSSSVAVMTATVKFDPLPDLWRRRRRLSEKKKNDKDEEEESRKLRAVQADVFKREFSHIISDCLHKQVDVFPKKHKEEQHVECSGFRQVVV